MQSAQPFLVFFLFRLVKQVLTFLKACCCWETNHISSSCSLSVFSCLLPLLCKEWEPAVLICSLVPSCCCHFLMLKLHLLSSGCLVICLFILILSGYVQVVYYKQQVLLCPWWHVVKALYFVAVFVSLFLTLTVGVFSIYPHCIGMW